MVRTAYDSLTKDPSNPMLPRTFRERYPPGSTFKVITTSRCSNRRPTWRPSSTDTDGATTADTQGQKLSNFGASAAGARCPICPGVV